MLKGDGKGGFKALRAQQSGICIRGAIRDIIPIKLGNTKLVLAAENNGAVQVLNNKAKMQTDE
jgi:hypothetical protein